MASYTTNYGLHQWEAADDFLRTDVNADQLLIDEALGEKAEIVTGTYTGDGEETRSIELGFAARAVILINYFGVASINPSTGDQPGGFAIRDGTGHPGLVLTETGFQVRFDNSYQTNNEGQLYSWLAVK